MKSTLGFPPLTKKQQRALAETRRLEDACHGGDKTADPTCIPCRLSLYRKAAEAYGR